MPVGNVTFFNDGGQLRPRVRDVTFFNSMYPPQNVRVPTESWLENPILGLADRRPVLA